MVRYMREKRGWIRVVEAFVAVLLITGIALIILDKGQIRKDDPSKKIYEDETLLLQKIQQDDSLRTKILNVSFLPVNSSAPGFPIDVENKILFEKPNYLDCEANICEIDDSCLMDFGEENIYVKEVLITGNFTMYSPRKLKLFCWKI